MNNDADNIALATQITIAWLSNPNTRVEADDVPTFLAAINQAVASLGAPVVDQVSQEESAPVEYPRAVTVRKSLADPEFIISMIDGKKYRSLTRHLNANGLSPADYRERYGLKADYPLVAPAYSAARREIAKKLGLGRKPGAKVAKAADQEQAPKARKGKSVAEAKAAVKAHLEG